MNELISIIIAVYNGEKYIKKCLDSIVNQSYKKLDIVVVNDGSTDNTLSICESYRDKRIKIISQNNKGLSLSRNVGIEKSRGKYIFFVDADDFIELDTIEYLYSLIKKYNVKMAASATLEISNYNFKVHQKKENIQIISGKEFSKKILLSINHTGTTWNKLLSRDVFENDIKFEDRPNDDVPVVYKIVLSMDQIVYSNQIKYFYFRHKNSISGIKDPNRQIDMYNAYRDRFEYIHKMYPNMIENEYCFAHGIMELYVQNNPTVIKYLDEQNAINIFNEMFTLKVLFSKIRFRDQIKMILFRISPKFCLFLINTYLKIKLKIRK